MLFRLISGPLEWPIFGITAAWALTGFYTDDLATTYAGTAGATILLVIAIYQWIYVHWIRPTGYVLIREDEYANLLLIKEQWLCSN